MYEFLTFDTKATLTVTWPPFLEPRLTPSSAIEFTSPPWLPAVEKRIDALRNLEPNWDGEGAPRIPFECAMAVWRFLFDTALNETPAPQLIPTSAGGIQIEWHLAGTDLEVRFDPKEPAAFFHCDAQGTETEGEVDAERSLIGSLLRALPIRNDFGHASR